MTSTTKEQRRSPRYRHELVVEMHDRRGPKRLHAIDVARHGIFVVTDDPPRERHLVQLSIQLPNGAIRAAASVTRVIRTATPDSEPGAGLQFFALSDDDKERWDAFIFYLHRTTPARGISRADAAAARRSNPPGPASEQSGPHSLPPPPTTPPVAFEDSRSGGATFLVKLKSVERLTDFADTHLASGGTVLFTPVLRAPGEGVTLIVVHPVSDEEFKLPGVIARAHTDRPKRLEIHFVGLNPKVLNAFRAFVRSGRPPPRDEPPLTDVPQPQPQLEPKSAAPPAKSPPAKSAGDGKEFDLDVDVFDEDTLDTDDRIGDVPSNLPKVKKPGAAPSNGEGRPPDPGLSPSPYLLRCNRCEAPPYAVDIGPCRGTLGFVADHTPMMSMGSNKVVSVPRLINDEERSHRVQTYLQQGGQLNASVDLMTLLGAVALVEPAIDPENDTPLKTSRAVERLAAAAKKLSDALPSAATKVKCASCKDGALTIERVQI